METWDAIRARRNVRSYTGQAIGRADLERVVPIAAETPGRPGVLSTAELVRKERAVLRLVESGVDADGPVA